MDPNLTVWMETITRSGVRAHVAAMQGMRPTMEDATAMRTCEGVIVFGLFDGHGGPSVATKAARSLCDMIAIRVARALRAGTDFNSATTVVSKECFQEFNDGLNRARTVGSCAVVSIIDPTHTHVAVANVGDSRAVVKNGKQLRSMTTDHNYKNTGEVKRVEMEGGYIEGGRLEGTLAITRALGDTEIKAGLSCEPDVTHLKIKPSSRIIMFCDGLYEREEEKEPTSNQVVKNLIEKRQAHADVSVTKCPSAICLSMRDLMRETCGSSYDNMSMAVLQLDVDPSIDIHRACIDFGTIKMDWNHPAIREIRAHGGSISQGDVVIMDPRETSFRKVPVQTRKPVVVNVPGYPPVSAMLEL